MTKNRADDAGTTLLETLISLAIMAMIAVMMGSLLSGTARFLGRAHLAGQDVDQIVARDQLRAYLEGALISPFPADHRPLFEGDSRSMRFLSSETQGVFWPGEAVEVYLGRSQETGAIALGARGAKGSGMGMMETGNSLTSPGGDLSIAYFGQVASDQPPAWRADWAAGWAAPRLVRITLSDERGVLPPLILWPAKKHVQSEISASSLLPPATPSRP
ncbi:hypothetical protein GCM10007315_32580 [Gemmobacter tilapiae]|uniref:Prepilin-type N-terminal cleavage/methylation domain-containing protein n=1 Tax=Neogemmobacter tilapiae TaxID=875041 RepID=A0A918U108_9RHOB|nr:hypothetical protein GCM10007315_32580 [Gemmobacter tilapiae]